MEPDKNLQKKIGIVFSVVIMLTVFTITIVGDKKPASVPTVDQSSEETSTTTVQNPVVYNPPTPPQNIPPPKTTPPTPVKKVTPTPPVDTPKKVTSVYKNGSYTATGNYMSPGGEDQITVTLTLKNDIITAISVIPEAQDNTSLRYDNKFVSGYKAYVIGQNIANVHLTRVSGSSLTPIGFDNALAQIKAQAKA